MDNKLDNQVNQAVKTVAEHSGRRMKSGEGAAENTKGKTLEEANKLLDMLEKKI